uniref:non-specific serine/threonine protein kinase n=1 Tax=Scophthalmus maximus TaxID=52904 RepID=A0A8D3B902_SCOMX
METVGKFEFSRKDLIGHGAFAVVFKGRHREKHDWEVAVKCINKKNLAKSQTLLGKEIKILKASLLSVFPNYCNGGDLADYLHSKGTLSEDTIRVFLQQIAGAMRVLQAKGIIHRDLKPQNILLSYPQGRKSHSNNTCIKIADFGFARYLQNNMMAATLCGSPMYMAPEVIMSQNYDAKADLWSIGTILFQCLTGKAPFQASSPQDLRLFYEKNKNLSPNIPRETSSHLRHLLLGLLQRNHKDRMDFGFAFNVQSKKPTESIAARPLPSVFPLLSFLLCFSSCVYLRLSFSASLQQSLAEVQHLRAKALASPTQEAAVFLLKDSSGGGGSSKNSSSCDTDDFVMVPPHFTSKKTCIIAIPVPTQVQNYQRLEQNLHSSKQDGSPRSVSTNNTHCSTVANADMSPHHIEPRPTSQQHPQTTGLGTRLHSAPCLLECVSGGGRQKIRKQHSDPVVAPSSGLMAVRTLHSSPRLSELMQRSPLPTILGSPSRTIPPFDFPKPPSSPNLVTFLAQQGLVIGSPCRCLCDSSNFILSCVLCSVSPCPHLRRRSQSAGRLSDMLLMAAFGPGGPAGERGSTENLTSEKAIEITVPPSGGVGLAPGSSSPAQVIFTVGSPPSGSTPPQTSRQRKYSGSFISVSPAGSLTSRYPQTGAYLDGFEAPSSPRYSFTDPITANMGGGPVTFEAPELPEETLMEQEHTDTVQSLRFTLDFARCLMEVAGARGAAVVGELGDVAHPSLFQQQSLVADQISSLSREWSHAEQLVLYLKTAELLSTALHTAKEQVKQGKLYPSATVKQVVKRLNELYKSSVASCRTLSTRLERFFDRKHRLMDQITSITAERLLFSHTVQMVQAAALDEMFHQGEASVLRYHKALLLMEGLSLLLTEQDDILSVSKCKLYTANLHVLMHMTCASLYLCVCR